MITITLLVENTARGAGILGEHGADVRPTAGGGAARPIMTPGLPTRLDCLPSVVGRHPLRLTDLPALFPGWRQERIEAWVSHLLAAGRVQRVERGGESFLVGAALRYPAPIPRPRPASRVCARN